MNESRGKEIQCCCIQQQILEKLAESLLPIKAIDLSKQLGYERAEVNTALYALSRRGKITMTSETPPLWAYDREDSDVTDREKSLLELMAKNGIPMSSHSIAYEMRTSKTATNRVLYDLERDGKIHRLQISPPIWRKSDHDSISHQKKRKADESNVDADQGKRNNRPTQKTRLSTESQSSSIQNKTDSGANTDIISYSCANLVDTKLATSIADAVWNKHEEVSNAKGPRQNTVLAGYVIRRKEDEKREDLQVVALGTGTKCLPGDEYTLDGSAIHDFHAEIIARRSLQRWIYHQLITADNPGSFASKCDGGVEGSVFRFHPFELWLYTSQCPCGDSAVYSRADPSNVKSANLETTNNHGKFRSKVEAGQGGNILGASELRQSFDGLKLGDRAQNLCCSDKLAKRCVVGIQGALLSQLIKPIYMTGIIVGDVFAHGHIRRGLCCRSESAFELLADDAPCAVYHLHHPQIGNAPLRTNRIMQISKARSTISCNWTAGDNEVEIIDTATGQVKNGIRSRLSKSSLFQSFLSLTPSSSSMTYYYSNCKSQSREYQAAKKTWKDAMLQKYQSRWCSKPEEVDNFQIASSSPPPDSSSSTS